MIKLSPRLRMAADMVRKGARLADIGTDHAYLPSALILDGTVPCAVAVDLRKGPLENAEATVRANSIEDKVELRLSDGLNSVLPDEADDIVIAGMGGILIKEILEAAPWVKNKDKLLILQPQSHSEDLRKYLFDNGFVILRENACFDDSKVYICFSANYTGTVTEHSQSENLLGGYKDKNDEASKAYVQKKLKRILTREKALSKLDKGNEELAILRNIIEETT